MSFLQYISSWPLHVDGIFQDLHAELWTKSLMHQIEVLRTSRQIAETLQNCWFPIPILLCVPNSNEHTEWDNEESITASTDRNDRWASRMSGSGEWSVRDPECVRVIYKNQQPWAIDCSPKQLVVVGACSAPQNTSCFWHTDAAKRKPSKEKRRFH